MYTSSATTKVWPYARVLEAYPGWVNKNETIVNVRGFWLSLAFLLAHNYASRVIPQLLEMNSSSNSPVLLNRPENCRSATKMKRITKGVACIFQPQP